MFAVASALGAWRRQLGGFVWSESLFVTTGGLVLGTVTAVAICDMLVKVLTGVFDPPPGRPLGAMDLPRWRRGAHRQRGGRGRHPDAAGAAPSGDRGAERADGSTSWPSHGAASTTA
jgi:hypothetical protein